MNKTDLIEHMALKADLSKSAAGRALEAAIEAIHAALARGDEVVVGGLGTFGVTQRPARTARNPRTGEPVDVAAARTARFRPGKALKDTLKV